MPNRPLSEPMLTRFTDIYVALGGDELTHCSLVMHIVSDILVMIDKGKGLLPVQG